MKSLVNEYVVQQCSSALRLRPRTSNKRRDCKTSVFKGSLHAWSLVNSTGDGNQPQHTPWLPASPCALSIKAALLRTKYVPQGRSERYDGTRGRGAHVVTLVCLKVSTHTARVLLTFDRTSVTNVNHCTYMYSLYVTECHKYALLI